MASSSSSSHSASGSSIHSWNNDVFLSFRGEDTRKTFVNHLYEALKQRLIRTYKDDIKLPQGESIGPSLLKAIEESRIAVIVFSKNYADSSWCLDELLHIMKCRVERGLTVMPIFYDVDPSEVRKQEGDFGKSFTKQEVKNITKAESWKKVLFDASNIAGWEPKHIANGHESVIIKKIVDSIFDRLFSSTSEVDEDLVGMTSRLQDLKSRLEMGSSGVRMVGIWGIGGGGKTTLATSLYMEISHHFNGHCIVENIREDSRKRGLKKLQEDILSAVFKTEVPVNSVVEGKCKMKNMLCHSNVLVLLDDVDDIKQLEALAGSHKWFGDGSRIIITSRDEHLLRTHKVDHVFPVILLSIKEATWLFNRYAYNEKKQIKDYESLSLSVVSYAAGLPLALKVLGSFLYDKNVKEWTSTLARLKNIPEMEIVEILKISYDGLKAVEKELFLDIACFFRGSNINQSMEILEACGYYPDIGITVLRQKALITVSKYKSFDMHDLVQEMGHYIVRGEHPMNPEKHSRVWKKEEIENMCFRNTEMENDKIEALQFNGYSDGFSEIISKMKKLRWLWVSNPFDDYAEGPNFLSNELRYIYWQNYPASSFPDKFHPTNLVVLILSSRLQKELWKGYKHLPQLKELIIYRAKKLLSTPDFNGLPRLQKLELYKCKELKEIHPSLGNHRSLKYVSVSRCRKLRKFPMISKMESLVKLSLQGIGGEGDMTEHLFDLRCQSKPFQVFSRSLRKLDLNGCHLKDGEIPSDIGELHNLRELDLSHNEFSRLDFSLSQLARLKILNLTGCYLLVKLPELPSSIAILIADSCKSLTSVGDFHTYCKWLCEVSLIYGSVVFDGEKLLKSMLKGKAIENHSVQLQLEGLEIPKGFISPLRNGGRCTLQLTDNWFNDFSGFLMCAVLEHDSILTRVFSDRSIQITMMQTTSGGSVGMDPQHDMVWKESSSDELTWVGYVSFGLLRHIAWLDETYNTMIFSIIVEGPTNLRNACSGFGVRLVPRKSGTNQTETSTYSSDRYTHKFRIVPDSTNLRRATLFVEPRNI